MEQHSAPHEAPDSSQYAHYHQNYVSLVPTGDILATLASQWENTKRLLSPLTDTQALFRYAPEKWSIKEVVRHIIDAERVFAYRALRFARNDATELASFHQNGFNDAADADQFPLGGLLEEFEHVRRANLCLFRHLDSAAWGRSGIAAGHPVSVHALVFIIAGHERHHFEILKNRYLPGLPE